MEKLVVFAQSSKLPQAGLEGKTDKQVAALGKMEEPDYRKCHTPSVTVRLSYVS